jgi:FkbM family methyltransferase
MKICLAMIVKNEERSLGRCLRSVAPFLSSWVIEDTGSTDRTKEIAREVLGHLPGQVVEVPWKSYHENRTLALALARMREDSDYTLMIDADEELLPPDPRAFDDLTLDGYLLTRRLGTNQLARLGLFRTDKAWRYEPTGKGGKHEHAALDGPFRQDVLRGVTLLNHMDSGQVTEDPLQQINRYAAEALEFEAELEADRTDTRTAFYLAQSYRDSLQTDKAIKAYLHRADMPNGWVEETYMALVEAARLMVNVLGSPEPEIEAVCLRAHEIRPTRAEALYLFGRYLRMNKKLMKAELILREVCLIPKSDDLLLVEFEVYEWKAVDDLAVTYAWEGKHELALELTGGLLNGTAIYGRVRELPEGAKAHVQQNHNASLAAIQAKRAPPASAETEAARLATLARRQGVPRYQAPPMGEWPTVTMVVLAKQKGASLPLYLECLEELDYPKGRIHLYIRTNDSTDNTEELLDRYVERLGPEYLSVHYDKSSVDPELMKIGVHDWESRRRFTVLNRLREESVKHARDNGSDFYFIADCDNWVVPWTLTELVKLDLPVVAPFLRHNDLTRLYSNYHHKVDPNGWFLDDPGYGPIWSQTVKGLIECECVHCTYLIRRDVLPVIYYEDPDYPSRGNRYDYVLLSESLRLQEIPQILDNREIYGWLSLDEQPLNVAALRAARIAERNEKPKHAFLEYCRSSGHKTRSQSLQDLYVAFRLGDKRDGYFVEVGAADGIRSNTLMLEEELGWHGVLVEPYAYWHEALRKNRPNALISTMAVYNEEAAGEPMDFLATEHEPELATLKISNTDKWKGIRANSPVVQVRTISLLELLEHYDAPPLFDYLSIDTEGSELEILKTAGFGIYKPKVITVEHNHDETKRQALFELLTSRGYVREFPELSAQDDWYYLP